jgi:hypothetical protein
MISGLFAGAERLRDVDRLPVEIDDDEVGVRRFQLQRGRCTVVAHDFEVGVVGEDAAQRFGEQNLGFDHGDA